MKKSNKRVTAAKKALGFDRVIEVVETADYVQICGTMGGYYLTFRVYDNGDIVER